MSLKVGDMVRIVELPNIPFVGDAELLGLVGTISGHCSAFPLNWGVYWYVDVAGGIACVMQDCLRLIPGDSEGREVVRWDDCAWSPALVQA